jgi:predicted ArsR family transcriptional regulator
MVIPCFAPRPHVPGSLASQTLRLMQEEACAFTAQGIAMEFGIKRRVASTILLRLEARGEVRLVGHAARPSTGGRAPKLYQAK